MDQIQLKHYAQTSSRRLSQLEWTESALIQIERGRKCVFWGPQNWEISAGQWLWLPAGCRLDIQNWGENGLYSARAILFSREYLTRYLSLSETGEGNPQLLIEASPELWAAWQHTWQDPELPSEILQIRALEVLAWLGMQGIQLTPRPFSFRSRIARIISADPGASWQIETMAAQLNMSSDTLQRRLQNEGTSYSQLVRSLRMEYALDLLQTSSTTIEWIASQVGYQSRSKFAKRFKERFGINPHEIRKDS